MAIGETTFAGLLAGLYGAGLGQNDWHSAMRAVADAFGGAGSVIFDLDPATGQIANWIGPGLEAGADEYTRHIASINPCMHYSLQAPAGRIAWDYRVRSEEQMRRDEYYAWSVRSGVKYFIGTRLFDDLNDRTTTLTSVNFSPKHGHVTRAEIETYSLLTSHIGNAWRLRKLTLHQHATEAINALMETQANCGVVLFDQSMRCIGVNDAAAAILQSNDGLMLRDDGVLTAPLASETRKLEHLIQDAWRSGHNGTGAAGSALTVTRRSGSPRHIVRIMPICAPPGPPRPADLPAVLVTITDPVAPIEIEPDALASLYGLSPREADLAVQLSAGLNLRDAAAVAGMRYNTARNHLRLLFEKTGAKSQLQLVSVLRSLTSIQ